MMLALALALLQGLGSEDDLAATITARELEAHVRFLASDLLEGRESGQRGGAIAAAYIASQFAQLGLEPAGEDGYYQRFDLAAGQDAAALLVQDASGATVARATADDGLEVHFTSTAGDIDAPVVFCGYGLRDAARGYDDFAGIDVKGKIVVVLKYAPPEDATRPGSQAQAQASERRPPPGSVMSKVALARELGAAALVVIPGPLRESEDGGHRGGGGRPRDGSGGMPVVLAPLAVGEALLGVPAESLRERQSAIDGQGKPGSFAVQGRRAHLTVTLAAPTTAINVIGRLAGSDPVRKSEYVVLGAHYDHIGMRDGQVCNGADDNASGTAGVLEIAEAFALSPVAPPRSLLFIAFAAEEKGLLGSHYFVTHPTVPRSAIKAMLNIDMIGRNKPGWVQAVAGDSGPELRPLLWAAAGEEKLQIDDQMNVLFAASDHGSFYRQGIPALFLWTTLHADHHQPSDDVERIDFAKMRSVTRLAMRTLARMAALPGEFHFASIDENALPRLRFD